MVRVAIGSATHTRTHTPAGTHSHAHTHARIQSTLVRYADRRELLDRATCTVHTGTTADRRELLDLATAVQRIPVLDQI